MVVKKPSVFNEFMKNTLAKIKAENQKMKHTEAFKQAALQWTISKQNPKNK